MLTKLKNFCTQILKRAPLTEDLAVKDTSESNKEVFSEGDHLTQCNQKKLHSSKVLQPNVYFNLSIESKEEIFDPIVICEEFVKKINQLSLDSWISIDDIFTDCEVNNILKNLLPVFNPVQISSFMANFREYSLIKLEGNFGGKTFQKIELLFGNKIVLENLHTQDEGRFFLELLEHLFWNFDIDLDSKYDNWMLHQSFGPSLMLHRSQYSELLIIHDFYLFMNLFLVNK